MQLVIVLKVGIGEYMNVEAVVVANRFDFSNFSLEFFVFCLVFFIFDTSRYTCSISFRLLTISRSSGNGLCRHLWMRKRSGGWGAVDVGHYGSADVAIILRVDAGGILWKSVREYEFLILLVHNS